MNLIFAWLFYGALLLLVKRSNPGTDTSEFFNFCILFEVIRIRCEAIK